MNRHLFGFKTHSGTLYAWSEIRSESEKSDMWRLLFALLVLVKSCHLFWLSRVCLTSHQILHPFDRSNLFMVSTFKQYVMYHALSHVDGFAKNGHDDQKLAIGMARSSMIIYNHLWSTWDLSGTTPYQDSKYSESELPILESPHR